MTTILDGLKLENPCLFRARLSGRFGDDRDYGCHGGIDLTYRNKNDGLYLKPALPGWLDFAGEDKKNRPWLLCTDAPRMERPNVVHLVLSS